MAYPSFSTTGFTDWHHATGQNKGFNQHCSSAAHKAAKLLYHDHIERVKKGEQVGAKGAEKDPGVS